MRTETLHFAFPPFEILRTKRSYFTTTLDTQARPQIAAVHSCSMELSVAASCALLPMMRKVQMSMILTLRTADVDVAAVMCRVFTLAVWIG
mmetsp:Transcript_12531/g.23152  ORF Transcript_12531/g.23152 Transcript_12531/m.23152 type:complete len:91 (+) Transcript_12531:163-435(+)